MDAFYASIEQRDHPEYRGKPVAVGYAGDRGVVAAASYEARKYGVRSAMASKTALKKCPHLIFAPSRFDVYRSVSRQIMEIFLEYTELVEPLSLDEAFLDVTENYKDNPSATHIAREIKDRIKAETGLTASAGVSINKFLAKIASDYMKPDGLFVIKPHRVETFVESLEIDKFYGVGKVTAEKMYRLGIRTGRDLKRFTENELVNIFGKAGHSYYDYSRGIDEREVSPHRIRKSLGAENTFLEDINDADQLEKELESITKTVWERISKKEFYGRTVTLKVKYEDFEIITRSRTYQLLIADYETLWAAAVELLGQIDFSKKKIRLLGVTMSNTDVPVEFKVYQLKLDL